MPQSGGAVILDIPPLSLEPRKEPRDLRILFRSPDEVHLWTADLDRYRSLALEAARILTQDEKDRAARFHFQRHQERFLAGRLVLRKILSIYTGIPPAELALIARPEGKPRLGGEGSGFLYFNQSESQGRTLIGLAKEREVGVDLEWIDPGLNVREVARVALHRQERERLDGLEQGEQKDRFYALWTIKEAYLKGIGTGLRTAPDLIAADLDCEPVSLAGPDGSPVRDWNLRIFRLWEEYCAALAVNGALEEIVWRRFEDLQSK